MSAHLMSRRCLAFVKATAQWYLTAHRHLHSWHLQHHWKKQYVCLPLNPGPPALIAIPPRFLCLLLRSLGDLSFSFVGPLTTHFQMMLSMLEQATEWYLFQGRPALYSARQMYMGHTMNALILCNCSKFVVSCVAILQQLHMESTLVVLWLVVQPL